MFYFGNVEFMRVSKLIQQRQLQKEEKLAQAPSQAPAINKQLLYQQIKENQERMKEQIVISNIEEYQLILREKYFFYDKIAVRLSRICDQIENQDAGFQTLTSRLELLVMM